MPKNNMDTIFNTLDNIARKKELTRSDEKEIRRQLSSLLTEMANTSDKTLKTEYLDKYNKLKENHADALKAAEEALNEEQKASLAEIMQKSEENKARVEENKERAEETNLDDNAAPTPQPENTSANDAPANDTPEAPQPEKVEETKTEETKTEENNASSADDLPPIIDLSVLNKDPAELTEADKQILQNIINSEYTTDTAKANARILSEGKPLPDTAAPGAPAPAMDMSVLNASPYEISAEGRENLQNIINSPHTSDIAKENAAKLMADADRLYQVGNVFLLDVVPFSEWRRVAELDSMNEAKTQAIIMGFLLLNIFLGVVGTFWFRTQHRRSEIALRMAFGSTRAAVFGRLIAEGLLLLTLMMVPAMFIAFHIGYAELVDVFKVPFTASRFFLCVGATWLLMALMIVAGIGYPARQAMRIQPAEALHDE